MTREVNMKGRESGMPAEDWWASFFDAEVAIQLFVGQDAVKGDVVEFGSGYGTFTLPVARHCHGFVNALDIEPVMVARVQDQANANHLTNIRAALRDFVAQGTGLESGSQAHAMIYNLLHLESPVELLKEAYRVLAIDGTLSVMHWRSDIATPRGPSLDIRPSSEQCKTWIEEAGFHSVQPINLQAACPFHFGLLATR
jgi:SAM-dependent methyltransferase